MTNGGLESYTTNNLNQYTKVSGVSYFYDNNGNLWNDGTSSYAYDSENRLTSIGSYTYTYNPFGSRVRKEGPGVDVTYVYDGDQVIEERDSGSVVIATYVYGPGIDECIRMDRGGQTYYYHYDRLGSVVNLSNSSGDLVETYQYDAWGNADTYGAVDNPYFFTGRRYDPETGNYYYRARYYKPSIGRFLQTDPLGYIDGPNPYTYVTNNPVNFIDPFGLDTYYIDRVLGGDKPTNNPVSHSFVAITDKDPQTGKEVVTETYSFGNNSKADWFHNDPDSMKAAQKAIDTGVGIDWKGPEELDLYITQEFIARKNLKWPPYDIGLNNCKHQASYLIRDARANWRWAQILQGSGQTKGCP